MIDIAGDEHITVNMFRDHLLIYLFAISWTFLNIYLCFFHSNSAIFWISSLAAAFSIIIQINYFNIKMRKFIILEIFLLMISLKFVSFAIDGVNRIPGVDTYYELDAIRNIINFGWNPNILNSVASYPCIHFICAFIDEVSCLRADYLIFLITIILCILVLSFYILTLNIIFIDSRITLLSALAFVYLSPFVLESFFGRTLVSQVLFYCVLFLILKCNVHDKIEFSILSILVISSLLFAHPYARLILLILMITMKILHTYSPFIFEDKNNYNLKSPSRILIYLVSVGILAYFIYLAAFERLIFHNTIQFIFTDSTSLNALGSAPLAPLYWRIYLFGTVTLIIFFTFFLLLSDKRFIPYYCYVFLICSLVILFLGYVAYHYNFLPFNRTMSFFWPIFLVPISQRIISSKKRLYYSFFIFILIIINIFGYFPSLYDNSYTLDPHLGEIRLYLNDYELTSINTLNLSGKIIGDYYIHVGYIYYKGYDIFSAKEPYLSNNYNIDYSWIFIKPVIFIRGDKLFELPKHSYNSFMNNLNLIKVYDNGEINVLGRSQNI